MLEFLKSINASFDRIEEASVNNEDGLAVGYHHSVLGKDNLPLSSGCHYDKNTAKRIAICEFAERAFVQNIFNSKISNPKLFEQFLLNDYPTTSGFAAGFENEATKFRSICEAIERWIWSKWIDEKYRIPKEDKSMIAFSPLAQKFLEAFDEVLLFRVPIIEKIVTLQRDLLNNSFDDALNQKIHVSPLCFTVCLGIKDEGVFPGSRVSSIYDDIWTHPVIEAWRHLQIFNFNSKNCNTAFYSDAYLNKTQKKSDKVIIDRINYFGCNKNLALQTINEATKKFNLIPALKVLTQLEQNITQPFYLWRAICHDYIPWHLGGVDRFVY